MKQFLSYFKNYICKFMQANLSHHKLFHFCLLFWIWRFGKEGKKLQKFEYLENEKSFLDEIKNIFHTFSRAIVWWKNKNLIKNTHALNFSGSNKTTNWNLINVSDICSKANRKRNTLRKENKRLKKRLIPFKAFTESQF